MYPSIVPVASSKWKDLYAWKYCSLVLPNFEYCCLKLSCRPAQSNCCCWVFNISYHSLASPKRVKQNLLTFWSSGKACVVILSFVFNKCTSVSSSGFPEKLGLKWDQFNWLLAIGMGVFSGKGLGLFGSSGSPGPSAGKSKGLFGTSAGISAGWFGGKFGKSTSLNDSSESELYQVFSCHFYLYLYLYLLPVFSVQILHLVLLPWMLLVYM